MGNTSEYKPKGSSNVTRLYSQNHVNNDIMKPKEQEDGDMEHEMYTKTEIDLKLDKISSDTQHGFEKVDLKFDQLRTEIRDGFENVGIRMEKMFSDFKLEQRKEKAENNKWLIALTVGTILSIVGIIISIIAILAQK
jgi:hypothetical protein|nr:MAG TPA: Protein of unknown function (DUF1640) [Caudoviricetes sp.]